MTSHATALHSADNGTDLGAIFEWVADGIKALLAPSQKDIETIRNDFGQYVWGVTGPLLTCASDEFDGVLKLKATPKVIKHFRVLVRSAAFKAWLKQAERQQKVAQLKPADPSPDPAAKALMEDCTERWGLLRPKLDEGPKAGYKAPSLHEIEAAYARFLISVLALNVAASFPTKFPSANVRLAWIRCTDAMNDLAGLFHIAREKLQTTKDLKDADLVFDRVKSDEDAYEKRLAARDQEEAESAYVGPEL